MTERFVWQSAEDFYQVLSDDGTVVEILGDFESARAMAEHLCDSYGRRRHFFIHHVRQVWHTDLTRQP